MCGLAGVVSPFEQNPPEFGRLPDMVSVLSHRGPDSSGVFVRRHVALGSTRLAVMDGSDSGSMPMVDPLTGSCLVFNGEIYNYREIASELQLQPRGGSDTEILLLSLLSVGIEVVAKLNGIFSFAFWDATTEELFLARDRLGVKPLYYNLDRDSKKLVFGSEIKAILASGVSPKPNIGAISDYLLLGMTDHLEGTFFDGVSSFPAAHWAKFSKEGITTKSYWNLLAVGKETPDSVDEAAGRFNEIALDAISLQSMSDVGLSVNLSSGLDSAYLAAALALLHDRPESVDATCYDYESDNSYEYAGAKNLFEAYDRPLNFHILDSSAIPSMLLEAMPFFEEPFPGIVSLAKFNSFGMSARGQRTVVIEGQGGDEIGAGYSYAIGAHVLDLLLKGKSGQAEAEVVGYATSLNMSVEEAFRRTFSSMTALQGSGGVSADGSKIGLYDLLDTSKLQAPREIVLPEFESKLDQFLYRDLFHTKLPRILRACDRSSMAFGKELRVPLLDHRLVEFMFHLPAELKIRDGIQRVTQRKALQLLGDPTGNAAVAKKSVIDPQRDWFRGPLRGWVRDIISSESFADRGFFDRKASIIAFDAFCKEPRGSGNSFRFWQMISLENWYRTFID